MGAVWTEPPPANRQGDVQGISETKNVHKNGLNIAPE